MWFLKKLFSKREEAAKAYSDAHPERDENGDVVKPFLDHLEDLRWMLIKMIITLCSSMIIGFFFRFTLVDVMNHPIWGAGLDPMKTLRFDRPIDSITLSLTLSFYAGLVVSFPLLFWFLAEFILPALTLKEKKYILPGILISFVLFLGGVFLSFFYITPATLRWLFNDAAKMRVPSIWSVSEYYSFVTHLCLALGLICELPILMVILNAIGLVSAKWLRSMRMYGYAVSLFLAGIISPTTDPIMLLFFAAPIMALFEGCIWLVYFLEKRRERKAALAEARSKIDPNEPID